MAQRRSVSSGSNRWLVALAATFVIGGCATRSPNDPEERTPLDANAPNPSADAVHVRYFGVSTLMFTSGDTSIMIDGFFSRPGLAKLLVGPLKPDVGRIETALSEGNVKFNPEAIPRLAPAAVQTGADGKHSDAPGVRFKISLNARSMTQLSASGPRELSEASTATSARR